MAATTTSPAPSRPDEQGVSKAFARLWRWLSDDALPLWWRVGADHVGGGFHEALALDGRPAVLPRRCRLHPRQAIAFALGARLGWPGPAREAATHAMSYFLERYRRPDGLFRASVTPDGLPHGDRALLYDQAFALLGLFAAHDLDPRPELGEAALGLLDRVIQTFKHPDGGFREHDATPFQSNAQMHLFEACIAWASVAGDPFAAVADELANLCLDRLIDRDRGVIDEFYDDAWRPSGRGGGRRIEPGHQYEWAWLLFQWRGASDRRVLPAAERLFAAAETSVEPISRVVPAAVTADGAVGDRLARLWPQTERLRAAAHLARQEGGDTETPGAAAIEAAAVVERYLATPLPGLWRDKLGPDGAFAEEPAPASSLYHLVGAIAALNGVALIGASPVEALR